MSALRLIQADRRRRRGRAPWRVRRTSVLPVADARRPACAARAREIVRARPVSTSTVSIQPAETRGSSKANALSISTRNTSWVAFRSASSFSTLSAIVEQKVGNDRQHRPAAGGNPPSVRADAAAALDRLQAAAGADRRRGSARRGSCRCAAGSPPGARSRRRRSPGRTDPGRTTADMPIVAIGARHGRGDRHAVDAAARREREIGDRHDGRRARLLELADDQRREVGERRLRPVDRREAVARLPVAQARGSRSRSRASGCGGRRS